MMGRSFLLGYMLLVLSTGVHGFVSLVDYPSAGALPSTSRSTRAALIICLDAKRQGKNPKGGRRGRQDSRGADKDSEDDTYDDPLRPPPPTTSTSRPTKTKRVTLSLDLPSRSHDDDRRQRVHVSVVEVDDPAWWEQASNTNPYGGRCWPSGVAVAQFLLSLDDSPTSSSILRDAPLLELGAGTGIPSIVAAAYCGAHVVATDVSRVALDLLRQGWAATTAAHANPPHANPQGTLAAQAFDLFSEDPLPLESSKQKNNTSDDVPMRPIVIAASMMYDADLAEALARRVAQAVHEWDAFVILGDCESGHREGGRDRFMAALHVLLPQTRRVTTTVTVSNAALKWQAKQVQLLLLNPPVDWKNDDDSP
jgi:predicted nicotinamide N-methyase